MLNKISIYIIFFSLTLTVLLSGQNSYYSTDKIIEYADFLSEQKKCSMARSEYQRALYILEDQEDKLEIIIKIGKCYYVEEKFDFSISEYKKVINNTNDEKLLEQAYYLMSLSYFQNRNFEAARKSLLENKKYIYSEDIRIKNEGLIASIYIIEHQWEEADLLINGPILKNTSLGKKLKKLTQSSYKNKKSTILGALLSSIIPGLGKVYVKNSGDGLISFITVSSMVALNLSEFSQNKEVSMRLLFLSGLSTVLYLGNIYGSYIAVKFYNQALTTDLHSQINKLIEV